ncbi:MAG: ATP-grasp domain-containing protein [Acidimicrobiales bacterium]
MPRLLLLVPTGTYRAGAFLAAAAHLGIDVVIGSERRQAMAAAMGDGAVVVPMDDVEVAVGRIAELHRRAPIDAVVAVDDQGLVVAAAASARLGLRHNRPEAVAAARDKALSRARLAATGVAQPGFFVLEPGADVRDAADRVGYPCVVKPVSRSGSQGVIRADDAGQAQEASERARAIVGSDEPLLVEAFVAGPEVAVEALLEDGILHVLAVFDKPDPLDGPFFEETFYVTPSRQQANILEGIGATAQAATAGLGLTEGPVHAELRVRADGQPVVIEVAPRSIGGLCARALRFGAGISLEEVILRHAAGVGLGGLRRESQASGVMMLPIRRAGVLERVSGQAEALAVDGVVGLEITIPIGRPVVPLPEGDRYLGFAFARGQTPADVEAALRRVDAALDVVVRPAP